MKWITVVSILAFIVMLAGAMYLNFTHRAETPVTTSIAVSKPDAPREVSTIITDASGYLIITYSDGSTQNAGRVKGDKGVDGQVPTSAQMAAAILDYCLNGTCDAKAPTQGDILSAIGVYCQTNTCRGKDAKPVTPEQIAVAVTNYCADGRCVGATGATGLNGTNGKNADPTMISCVIRKTNNVDTRYVAWKYTLEPVTAYRDIYKLPSWSECNQPIDLRSV